LFDQAFQQLAITTALTQPVLQSSIGDGSSALVSVPTASQGLVDWVVGSSTGSRGGLVVDIDTSFQLEAITASVLSPIGDAARPDSAPESGGLVFALQGAQAPMDPRFRPATVSEIELRSDEPRLPFAGDPGQANVSGGPRMPATDPGTPQPRSESLSSPQPVGVMALSPGLPTTNGSMAPQPVGLGGVVATSVSMSSALIQSSNGFSDDKARGINQQLTNSAAPVTPTSAEALQEAMIREERAVSQAAHQTGGGPTFNSGVPRQGQGRFGGPLLSGGSR
jgi:hypothetical protein